MIAMGIRASLVPVLLLCGTISVVAQCPSSQNPTQPYRVGVANASTAEVFRLDSGETRVVARFKDGTIVEQTFYGGLIRTEHIAKGTRTPFSPRQDLKRLFPLKVGETHQVEFDAQEPNGQRRLFRAEYKVVGKDQIMIGPCRYEVLKVEHSNRYGDGPLSFIHTDWYAPDIRLVVAREYKERDGKSDLQKYDTISLTRLSLDPSNDAIRESERVERAQGGAARDVVLDSASPPTGSQSREKEPLEKRLTPKSASKSIRSIVSSRAEPANQAEMIIFDQSGGCHADQCPLLRFRCSSSNPVEYTLQIPFLNEEEEARIFVAVSNAMQMGNRNGWKLVISISQENLTQQIDDLHFDFSAMDGYSVSITSSAGDIADGKGVGEILRKLLTTNGTFKFALFNEPIRGLVEVTHEHRRNFQHLLGLCGNLEGNVVAKEIIAHAGNGLPKEILGMWCYYSPGENADARNYLRNDASAPKPDTPCRGGGNTEWIVIDPDGSYHGQEYGCRAVGVTVIDRGVVIKGTPGANAVYGLDARCQGKGATWRERARIEVERWGSALTIRRTNITPGSRG